MEGSHNDLWTEYCGQKKIIKRLEHAASGLTEGKMKTSTGSWNFYGKPDGEALIKIISLIRWYLVIYAMDKEDQILFVSVCNQGMH